MKDRDLVRDIVRNSALVGPTTKTALMRTLGVGHSTAHRACQEAIAAGLLVEIRLGHFGQGKGSPIVVRASVQGRLAAAAMPVGPDLPPTLSRTPTTPVEILVAWLDESPMLPDDHVARHQWLLGLIRLALDVGRDEGLAASTAEP